MKQGKGLLIIVIVLANIYCWGAAAVWAEEPQTHHITIRNFNFYPPDALINVGDTVEWTNEMKYGHWVISGFDMTHDATFFSPLLQEGHSFTFTFRTPGEYPYYCPIHSMQAIIFVMEPEGEETEKAEEVEERRRRK